MTEKPQTRWLIRSLWPLLGGAWGAWLGAGGYFDLNFNGQGLAAVLVGGYFVAFAVLGLAVGAITGAVAGGATEFLLRRIGLGSAPSLLVASLACLGACFAVSDAVQTRYPGIHPPNLKTVVPAPQKTNQSANPCLGKPPLEPRLRRAWELECR